MKTLGIIALLVASVGLTMFGLIVIPAERRGEDSCVQAMVETARAERTPVIRTTEDLVKLDARLHAATSTGALEMCEDHRRQRAPRIALCAMLLATLVAGAVMYKRGTREGS